MVWIFGLMVDEVSQVESVKIYRMTNVTFRAGRESLESNTVEETENVGSHTDLNTLEKECCKQNFKFYDRSNTGSVERFELPMVLQGKLNLPLIYHIACGYNLTDARIAELDKFLDEKGATKLTLDVLLSALAYHKNLDLINDQENEADEYLDAFVALGGQPNKEGFVSKELLIQIIKAEFELTIDMEEYLRKSGGDTDEIAYYQFCRLLDAGTGGHPSRISSFVS